MSENLDKQTPKTKEYYANYPGFRVTSGIKIPDGDLKGKYTDFAVMTDEIQGIAFYKDGLQKLVTNGTSYETVGMKVDEGDFAKIISAPNGNILIEAKSGDLEIRARNIRLHATNDPDGEMTIKATKHIYTKAPIIDIDGNLTNVLGKKTLSMGGNFVDESGGVELSSGTQTDSKQGGFLGMVLSFTSRFKDFLG